jgi:hypothetical protein
VTRFDGIAKLEWSNLVARTAEMGLRATEAVALARLHFRRGAWRTSARILRRFRSESVDYNSPELVTQAGDLGFKHSREALRRVSRL